MPLILECEERSYSLPDDTLVFALDDTGHESVHKENGACFGIGGCAFLVADYERLIEAPWNYMLQRFFPDTPRLIHSTDHLRNLSTEQLAALSQFFTRFQFFRLAVTVSAKTQNQVDVGYIDIVGAAVLQRVAEIASQATFSRIFIIFEASDRIERQVMQALSGKKLRSGDRGYAIELGLMPKSACTPALEVADVIVHTAGGQTRQRNECASRGLRKDFVDVFQTVDKRLVSFAEITLVEPVK